MLSSHPADLPVAVGGLVEQMAEPPAEIVSRLAASGAHHLYVDASSLPRSELVRFESSVKKFSMGVAGLPMIKFYGDEVNI